MRGPAFSFAAEVERQIEQLSADDFHRRQGHSKVLLEEWYPISRLGIHLKQPGLEVEVEGFGDNGAADGRIEERGFRDRTFDVQVTFVDDYEGAMRRELLRQHGVVPGTGPIARDKQSGTVIATTGAVDWDYNVKRAASGIAVRFSKKAAMLYSADTVLLIAFDDMKLLGRAMWDALFAEVDQRVTLIKSPFRAVYNLNYATNELVKAA